MSPAEVRFIGEIRRKRLESNAWGSAVYISEFQIWNYKSFRETEAIALSRGINIVTGQNNVGKTALLQALSLDSRTVPHRSIKTLPSARAFVQPSRVSVLVTLSNTEFLDSINDQTVFVHLPQQGRRFEAVPALRDYSVDSLNSFVKWFFSRESYTFHLWREVPENQQAQWISPQFPSFGLYETTPSVNPEAIQVRVDRDGTPVLTNNSPVQAVRDHDVGLRIAYRLHTLVYRFEAERSNAGISDFGSNSRLSSKGGNLPEVLGVLKGTEKVFDSFNQAVCDVLPQIARVTIAPVANQQEIVLWRKTAHVEGRRDLAFGLNESGTGIGQVLAILYVALTSQTPQVILIDEPQSFLHPGAARKLIEVLKQHPMHQYVISTHSPTIITAAKPETILLVKHDGNESKLERLDSGDSKHLRKYLDEIGASLEDVFGADGIVWVEGTTEEKCYPLIIDSIIKQPLMGKVIKAVVATGDLEGKHAEKFFDIYNRLSGAQSLIPPAVAFIFDDEGRSPEDKKILKNRGEDKSTGTDRVYFTGRRMYENYLLNAQAITEVLNTTDGRTKAVAGVDVQTYVNNACKEQKYFEPLDVSRGIDWIRADRVLKDLFWDVADLDYRKTTHSIELTESLLRNDPTKLDEVAELICAALGWVSEEKRTV